MPTTEALRSSEARPNAAALYSNIGRFGATCKRERPRPRGEARAGGVATRRLRQADSLVDTLFYLTLAVVTYHLHPEVIRRHATAIGICVGTLVAWMLLDLLRWRAAAGFHARSAKLFAAALGVWAVALYGFGVDGAWLVMACAAGTLSHIEGIAISLTLRRHVADVRSLAHALRLRRHPAAPAG